MSGYKNQRIALRYWLLGAGYQVASEAFVFAESYHQGKRKGGEPEFSHQVAIASTVRCFTNVLRYPEEAIATALLHDVREDYDVGDEEIRGRFGGIVADSVDAMTKETRGVKREEREVFAAIAGDANASVCKLADRVHNHSTMVDVFSLPKIEEYITETKAWIRPMAKEARRRFIDQEPVYEALSLVLENQVSLLESLLRASASS
jgi:(p)ppGpp synthase/HD superfamily hydrolase